MDTEAAPAVAEAATATTPPATPEPVAAKATKLPSTQDELDAIIDRVRGKVHRKYSDYDTVKAKAAQYDGAEQAINNATAAAQKATERADALEARVVTAALAAANTSTLDVDDLRQLIDTTGVTIADDGEVTGITEAIAAFLELKPQYVGKAGTAAAVPGIGSLDGAAKNPPKTTLTAQIAEAVTAKDWKLADSLKAQLTADLRKTRNA